MQTRPLGETGIQLTELGYGCASLWGKPKFTSDDEAEKLFYKAYDNGIRFFDTSYSYGTAEERLGKCLSKLNKADRYNVIISTKCGTRKSGKGGYYHNWSVEWMKRSVEISMKRLHVDYIDMLQLHGPQIDEISDEMVDWLQKLRKSGNVRSVGINTFDTDVLEWICCGKEKSGENVFDFVMLDYNILRQDREPLIKRLYDNRIGIIAGAPLAQSLYSNRVYKVRSMRDLWYLLRAMKNFRGHMIEGWKFRFVNDVDGLTGNQVALRYVLDNNRIASAVFGSVNPEHLVENIRSVDLTLSAEVRRRINVTGRRQRIGRYMDRK